MSRSYQTQAQSHAQEAGPSSQPLDLLTQNFAQFDYEEPQECSTSVFQSFMANHDELLSSTPLASRHNHSAPLGGSPVNIDDVTLEGDDVHSNPPSHPSHSQGPTVTPAGSPASSPGSPAVRIGETGEKRTSGARDAASATQAEHCALHHTRVPYLSDGELAVLSRRRGGT